MELYCCKISSFFMSFRFILATAVAIWGLFSLAAARPGPTHTLTDPLFIAALDTGSYRSVMNFGHHYAKLMYKQGQKYGNKINVTEFTQSMFQGDVLLYTFLGNSSNATAALIYSKTFNYICVSFYSDAINVTEPPDYRNVLLNGINFEVMTKPYSIFSSMIPTLQTNITSLKTKYTTSSLFVTGMFGACSFVDFLAITNCPTATGSKCQRLAATTFHNTSPGMFRILTENHFKNEKMIAVRDCPLNTTSMAFADMELIMHKPNQWIGLYRQNSTNTGAVNVVDYCTAYKDPDYSDLDDIVINGAIV